MGRKQHFRYVRLKNNNWRGKASKETCTIGHLEVLVGKSSRGTIKKKTLPEHLLLKLKKVFLKKNTPHRTYVSSDTPGENR